MLHHRQQLHMGIAHFLAIGCKLLCDFAIIQISVSLFGAATVPRAPGAEMHFIDIERIRIIARALCAEQLRAAAHPFAVVKGKIISRVNNACGMLAAFRINAIRVRLQADAVFPGHTVFIAHPLKGLVRDMPIDPKPAFALPLHFEACLPRVEIPRDLNAFCAGRPGAKGIFRFPVCKRACMHT